MTNSRCPALRVVGSGSAIATASRGQACLALLRVNAGGTVLLDAGDGTSRALAMAGITPQSIAGIVVSHLHPDHAAGLPALVQQLRLCRVAAPEPAVIWLPREAESKFADVMAFYGLSARRLDGVVRIRYFEPNRGFAIGGTLWITPLPNAHLTPGGRGPLHSSFSLLAELEEHRLFYSGDLGGPDDLHWPAPERVDLAVVDAGHLSADAAARAAFEQGAERVLLTHLEQPSPPRRAANPDLLWAHDGMEIDW